MKQKQVTQIIPEGRVKKSGGQDGITVTVDVGHKSQFDRAVTNKSNRIINTNKDNTIVDYSDGMFDWHVVRENIDTILEETVKKFGNRLAETTIVIASVDVDDASSIGFNIIFAITTAVMNAVNEL